VIEPQRPSPRVYDPPRSDTAATIAAAGDMGVGVKMITGDAIAIGEAQYTMLCSNSHRQRA